MAVTFFEKTALTFTAFFGFLGLARVKLASYCVGYTCCNCILIKEHFERKKMAVSRKLVHPSINATLQV